MTLSDKIRGCDSFGATIGLNYAGETSYNTLGGGVFSVCLKALIFAFFCMKMAVVVGYDDNNIVTYQIYEDRHV